MTQLRAAVEKKKSLSAKRHHSGMKAMMSLISEGFLSFVRIKF